ncbi:MAG: hypothetical protein IJF83_09810 [Methanobrevibacter sp.]|nr:hypothetical protein [Methanobrevibacter sp.]
MKFKSLFALLAIFVVIMSASAVCADDTTDANAPDDGVADTGVPDEDEPVEDEGDDIAEEGDDVNGTDALIVISPGVDEAEGSASGASETPLSNNAAGNPILVLLAALAVLGVIPFKRN